MKYDIWLRANWRLPAVLAIPFLSAIAGSLFFLFSGTSAAGWSVSLLVAGISAGCVARLFAAARRPRLAYASGCLDVYLTGSRPIRVPIELVECFFLGQGPSLLPPLPFGNATSEIQTATLIVRLAESAVEWQHRDVRTRLGMWCEGYITIRGTACEPLDGRLVARLNRRLVEVKRETTRI
jgi:hypothetical protein